MATSNTWRRPLWFLAAAVVAFGAFSAGNSSAQFAERGTWRLIEVVSGTWPRVSSDPLKDRDFILEIEESKMSAFACNTATFRGVKFEDGQIHWVFHDRAAAGPGNGPSMTEKACFEADADIDAISTDFIPVAATYEFDGDHLILVGRTDFKGNSGLFVRQGSGNKFKLVFEPKNRD